jgi:hypothetical protein
MDRTLPQDDRLLGHAVEGSVAAAARAALAVLRTLAIILALAVSGPALTKLGIHYDDSEGGALGKIHPGTYVLFLALALVFLREGVSRFIISATVDHPGALALAWSAGCLVVYDVMFVKAPLSALIDTFLCPIAALLVFDRIGAKETRWLTNLIHAIYVANAVLSLFEMASGWHLTPLIVNGELLTRETRSTALMGQPLTNAVMTGTYIVLLACGADRALPSPLRLALIALQATAMVPMGGRVASILTLLVVTILVLRETALIAMGKRFSVASALAAVIIVPMVVALVAIAYEQGFFNNLLERFAGDNRSAETRLIMFDLFPHFTWPELLFGPNQETLRSLMWTEGTEYGIESFPVALSLTYGIVPTFLLLMGLAIFAWDIVRSTRGGATLPLLLFFAIGATSLSIGAKTVGLAAVVMLNMILFEQARAPRREAEG